MEKLLREAEKIVEWVIAIGKIAGGCGVVLDIGES
jgi:hypothetical protein